MYVTAQRVRTRDKKEGINTFLFLHGPSETPDISWSNPDVVHIADHHPGALVLQRIEQDYGMNDVLSFLDVAASDSYEREQLRTVISSMPLDPARDVWSIDRVAVRFFYSNANYRDIATEFQALRAHLLLLLPTQDAGIPRSESAPPLRIIAEDHEGLGIVYSLDRVGQQRLLQHHPRVGAQTQYARVRVAYEDRKTLVALLGDDQYHRDIARCVTGLTAPELAQLGGATIADPGDQQGSKLEAATEELAGQTSGDWFGPGEDIEPRDGWPTGAILQAGDSALDLVYIERAWFPLSEAGLYTYLHSAGQVAGETWRFVTRGNPRITFRASLGPKLTRQQVVDRYGADAGARCRDDRLTVQLHLTRE